MLLVHALGADGLLPCILPRSHSPWCIFHKPRKNSIIKKDEKNIMQKKKPSFDVYHTHLAGSTRNDITHPRAVWHAVSAAVYIRTSMHRHLRDTLTSKKA
jgi:hypothetical protein